MRWSFKKMWACMIFFAMFSIAFVGVATENQNNAVSLNDSVTTTFSNEGTRGPGAPRVVLIERFTNDGCGPCVYASQVEDVFTDDHNAGNLAIVKYHTSWPDGADPMYLNNPTPQQTRWTYYGVSGVPDVIVDGASLTFPYTYDEYYKPYESRAAIDSPFAITVEGSLGLTTGTVYTNVTAVDAAPIGDLRVRVILYFNNVDYPSAPGGNGETHFEFVFMDFIPDIAGRTLVISQGQTLSFMETFTIPTEIPASGADPAIPVERSQLGIVSFVQDESSMEVHQAAVLPFADLSVVPMGISIIPINPNLGDAVGVSGRFMNSGDLDISNAFVTAYIDQVGGDPIGPPISTGPLMPGQMKFVGLGVWNTTGQPDIHRIYVKIDVENDYYEGDESNNVGWKDVVVTAQFDVGVSQMSPFTEAMLYPMSNYSLEGAIENYGQNPIGNFDVGIELVQLGPPDVPYLTFMDDFEGGEGGWTENAATSSWEHGAPPLTPGTHSGVNVWGTTLSGDVPLAGYDWLMTPVIDLPLRTSSITLNFWHWYDFEVFGGRNRDCGNLWMSASHGSSWTQLGHYVGANGAWTQESKDITTFAGQPVRFAFELVSDIGSHPPDLGWYLDDFEVVSMMPTETSILKVNDTRMSTILAPGEADSLIWNHKIIMGGTHKLYVWTPLGGDQNPTNDLMTVTFDIDPTKWRNTLTPTATLISSPLLLTDSSIGSIVAPVRSTISQVRTFDAISGTWLGYDPTKPANSLSTVDYKMGMWATNPSGGYIDFTGTIPGVTVDIQLETGWNLVGYPSMTDRTVSDALMGVTYDTIEGFDPTGPYHLRELTGTDWMTAGQGYWIYVSSQQIWSVNA